MSWRRRTKPPRDPVAEQLRDIARQGAATAHVAHAFAFLLILLFSLASLVALAHDALTGFLAHWHAGEVDIPSGISVAVSTLLVPAMDYGMLYAASNLRILRTRRAGASEQLLHWIVIGVVVITEASTYIYMAAIYERPHTAAEWAIICLRGLTAPFLSVYLAMARPLPVTARDILAQSELAAGTGVIHDVTTIANNADAPLADKMMLYDASAVMGERDRARLSKMIAVAQIVAANASINPTGMTPYDTAFERLNTDRSNALPAPVRTPEPTVTDEDHHEGDEPPENDPNPPRGKRPASLDNTRGDVYRSNVLKVSSNTGDSAASVASVAYERTPKSTPKSKPKPRAPRADSGMSQDERESLRLAREEAGAKILAKDPDISVRAFARRVAVSTQHPIRESTAQGILASLRGRLPRSRSAEAAEQAAQAAQVMTNTN